MTSITLPAEWEPHDAVYIGWPSHEELWPGILAQTQKEVANLVNAIALPDPQDEGVHGEQVRLLYRGEAAHKSAQSLLANAFAANQVRFIEAPIGDIWLRDTAAIFVLESKMLQARTFTFNGWGEKYIYDNDAIIGAWTAEHAGLPNPAVHHSPFTLEGGAIECNGQGTILTTRQCLLNKNRNKSCTEEEAEDILKESFGAQKVIWLDQGLANDHTDGHIDNIARFLAPGVVACMKPSGDDDPNATIYKKIHDDLATATDASGQRFEIIEIPSPGRITDDTGVPVPASHMNFYIANQSLIMPSYAKTEQQAVYANEALDILAQYIDRPYAYALPASHILTGGGAFHCITQQVPRAAGF